MGSKPFYQRLNSLVLLLRNNPREAARIVVRRAISSMRFTAQYLVGMIFPARGPDRPFDGIARIRFGNATALNAGRCSVAKGRVTVVTDPDSGGYSALIPVTSSKEYDGPAVFHCQVDVLEGTVGLSAMRADHQSLISERVAGGPGLHQIDIVVPSLRDVGGILVRNSLATGQRSRATILSATAAAYPAERILRVSSDRPSHILRLPLRRYVGNEPPHKHYGYAVTNETVDTAAAAVIVIDAWNTLDESPGDRWNSNITEKLAPTLAALRSTGMAIIHASHDRPVHPLARPLGDETVIQGEIMDSDFIGNALRNSGIKRLFYMGYGSNKCLLWRPVGMVAMAQRGFDITLVRDASLASEIEESLEGDWFHKAMVHLVESNFGTTVSGADIQEAASALRPGNPAEQLEVLESPEAADEAQQQVSLTELQLEVPASPLFGFGEGDLLPDVISVSDNYIFEGAAVAANSPLRVIMPNRQWSYGFLLPINHRKVARYNEKIVIRATVAVCEGHIGIAGVDDSGRTLTTLEHFAGSGETTVSLTVDDLQRTRGIVFRTTSATDQRPEVTLQAITAHRPASLRLAPRRHDLGFDLFVILSPGKTATQTIEQTLLSLHPAVQVRRLHFISSRRAECIKDAAELKNDALSSSAVEQAASADHVRREIKMVRALGGSIAFVTGMREPVDRAIADTFQIFPSLFPCYSELQQSGPEFIDFLGTAFVKTWKLQFTELRSSAGEQFSLGGSVRFADRFFSEEFAPITGIDILSKAIDREAGFTLLKSGRTSALVYRYEDIERGLAAGLAELTGQRDIELASTNLAAEKSYAALYRDFRANFRIPDELCSAIYESPYIRHFYSDTDVAKFKKRWSESLSSPNEDRQPEANS
jgi:nicotinamidase-related amidase